MSGMGLMPGAAPAPDDQQQPAPPAQAAPDSAQQGQADQPAAGDQVGEGDSNKPNATPQQQQQFDDFVHAGMVIIFGPVKDPKPFQALLKNFNMHDDDAVGTLANVAVMIIRRIATSREFDTEVIFHAGIEIVQLLALAVSKAKIHDYTDKEVEAAIYRAADAYRVAAVKAGEVDPAEMKVAWQQMQQASQSGGLEQAFPDVEEHFAKDAEELRQALAQHAQGQQQPGAAAPAGGAPQQQQDQMAPPKRGLVQ